MKKHKLTLLILIIFPYYTSAAISSWELDRSLEIYINPVEKVLPIEEYKKIYTWNDSVAYKARQQAIRKANQEYYEDIQKFCDEILPILKTKLCPYDEDYWNTKIIRHCINIYITKALQNDNCSMDKISQFVSERLNAFRTFKFSLPSSYDNKWLLSEKEIDRSKKSYLELKANNIDLLLTKYQDDRNFFSERGISAISQEEFEYPLTQKEKDHLDVKLNNINDLAASLNSLLRVENDSFTLLLKQYSVRMHLERKGWSLESLKKASLLSSQMDTTGFQFWDNSLWSTEKIWYAEKYNQWPIIGWFAWIFYAAWID